MFRVLQRRGSAVAEVPQPRNRAGRTVGEPRGIRRASGGYRRRDVSCRGVRHLDIGLLGEGTAAAGRIRNRERDVVIAGLGIRMGRNRLGGYRPVAEIPGITQPVAEGGVAEADCKGRAAAARSRAEDGRRGGDTQQAVFGYGGGAAEGVRTGQRDIVCAVVGVGV
jgi:hypothetical protein